METETESYENFPENRGLLFVNLRLLDEKGRLVYGAENEVHVELEGDFWPSEALIPSTGKDTLTVLPCPRAASFLPS